VTDTGIGPGKMVTADTYRDTYEPDRGFEAVCTLARQRQNIDFLHRYKPQRILEVGCGGVLLSATDEAQALPYQLWTIVEPVGSYAAMARRQAVRDPRLCVIDGYLETAVAQAHAAAPEGYDATILSGVLHETTDPDRLLQAAIGLLTPKGRLVASVPNARSFHRLLASAMGLIPRVDTLSARDIALGHPQVFDRETFSDLLRRAGLTDLKCEGYLFKPFTNAQMEPLLAELGPALAEGLIRLGHQFPDNGAEICIEAVRN